MLSQKEVAWSRTLKVGQKVEGRGSFPPRLVFMASKILSANTGFTVDG